MDGGSAWTLMRDRFKRVTARRPGRTGAADWFEELFRYGEIEDRARPSGEPVLPAAAVESLTRQLNAVTPWHVRVDVQSRVEGTAVRCRSRLSFGDEAHGSRGDECDDAALLHLLNVLQGVQGFMVQRSKRAWPKMDRLSEDERDADWEAWMRRLPVPDGVVESGEARLWFGERDHPALELDPIPLH
jgi:hypothetical protein